MGQTVLKMFPHLGQLLGTALILQFAIEQLLLGGLEIASGLIKSFTHVLAQRRLGLLQQGVERGVGSGLTIADLAKHQQSQFTGNGAALHQTLLEEMGE
jgi:hypothetical protein